MKKVSFNPNIIIIPIPSSEETSQTITNVSKMLEKLKYSIALSYIFDPEHRDSIRNYIQQQNNDYK